VGLHLLDQSQQRQLIEEVRRLQRDPIEDVLDAPHVRRTQTPDHAEHLVPFLEQQLGKIRSVLPGDPGY
jgi:hypothetical protein